MKKILLASTILVGSAGVAAADVSFTGSAYMGLGTISQGAVWIPLTSASATAGMSGETDGGLGFGASFKISGGGATDITTTTSTFSPTSWVSNWHTYTSSTGNAGSVGDLSVWISGDFGKVTLSADASDPTTTIGYTGTFGMFTVSGGYTTGAIGPVHADHLR